MRSLDDIPLFVCSFPSQFFCVRFSLTFISATVVDGWRHDLIGRWSRSGRVRRRAFTSVLMGSCWEQIDSLSAPSLWERDALTERGRPSLARSPSTYCDLIGIPPSLKASVNFYCRLPKRAPCPSPALTRFCLYFCENCVRFWNSLTSLNMAVSIFIKTFGLYFISWFPLVFKRISLRFQARSHLLETAHSDSMQPVPPSTN